MLLSPWFILLCSAALIIAVPSSLVSRGFRMEKLRRVHRAAGRLIGGFRKFHHISHYMRDVLRWLPFPQRISYRIVSLVWRCLSGWAPSYLRELCRPLSSCAGVVHSGL